jgi:cation diffusion facilitator family transporter
VPDGHDRAVTSDQHQGSLRAILAALAANIGIAISKFVAFLFTRSSAMLAESIHSFADSSNQVLLLIGGRHGARPPDEEHPFGHGAARFLYAFLVAVVIFLAGGVFAIYEAWHKFADPHPLENPVWAFGVLVVAIGLESFSLRTAVKESAARRGRLSWPAFVRRTKAPELVVVLLEDLGALIGLVFALVGVSLAVVTHDGRWDAVGTLAIGVLLVLIAGVLARQTSSLLVNEAADPVMVTAIRDAVAATPGIERLIHLRTAHLGPDELLVGAKIAVDPAATAAEVARTIDAAEERIRAAVPYECVIYLEPDLLRP